MNYTVFEDNSYCHNVSAPVLYFNDRNRSLSAGEMDIADIASWGWISSSYNTFRITNYRGEQKYLYILKLQKTFQTYNYPTLLLLLYSYRESSQSL